MPDLDAVIEAVTADMFAAACGTPLAPSTVLGWRERLLAARDDYDRAARVAKPTLDRERLARAIAGPPSQAGQACDEAHAKPVRAVVLMAEADHPEWQRYVCRLHQTVTARWGYAFVRDLGDGDHAAADERADAWAMAMARRQADRIADAYEAEPTLDGEREP